MSIEIADVLVASTVINADFAAQAGVYLSPADTLRRLRGVGGHEHVFTRHVDSRSVDQFEVEIGEMDYGFEMGGILGMDFLRAARAVIDLGRLMIEFV